MIYYTSEPGYYTTDPYHYGPYPEDEAALDSDSDLTPQCAGCDGPVDHDGYCRNCREYGYVGI